MATAVVIASILQCPGETPLLLFNDSVEALRRHAADELYAPLARIRVRVLASVVRDALLALLPRRSS